MIYLSEKKPQAYHAGFKAREDIETILKNKNIQFIDRNIYDNIILNKISGIIDLIKIILKVKNGLFFQFIGYSRYNHILIKILKKLKKSKVSCIIHDLEGIRYKNESYYQKELELLKEVDYIIVQNHIMKDELQNRGLEKTKMYVLNIFDYLLEKEEELIGDNINISDICFAGNLSKSTFIYKFDSRFSNLKIDIFGINYKENNKSEVISYKGAYHPNEIHKYLKAKYGLIWDGEVLERCSGDVGEYMKYNTPHKFSLYIASGLPVIVWEEAAISKFILERGIGITIDSLENLEKKLSEITKQEYLEMKKQVALLRKDIIIGNSFGRVYDIINEEFKK